MKKVLVGFAALMVVTGAAAFLKREPLLLSYVAAKTEPTTLAERKALLAPHLKIYAPQSAAPPYPVVIQFHGCAGLRENFMAHWAETANREGFLAVAVDSHTPRDIDREEALATVCAGKQLIGQERAGDVLAAIELVRDRDDVDPDRIVVAGWSHGAWSIMDMMAMDFQKRAPAGLEDAKAPPALAGAVLVYPYCGPGSWTRVAGWAQRAPTLAFIAGADTIVDGAECQRVIHSLADDGVDAAVHFYPDADHVFDDPYLEQEYQYMYDAEAAADAERKYAAFLKTVIER